ncbi:MAG: hypothetical protein K9L68_03815 [Spirochaetales bacterium]|nr:hypothetical protein [Spirochaetales bacterium]MCF7937706.1 hypothetical protein [Spirochaetales bacterium]
MKNEHMIIDLLVSGDQQIIGMVDRAYEAQSEAGSIRVVQKEDLILLKRARSSKQDIVDIEKLQDESN